jgi:transcriptional regulator with XRE-family HTH domain
MTRALAERDMATVFRLLQEYGLSQRGIASRTGQSQSEISEVMSGRRIVSYDVLVRIADGLAISRGYLGLAYFAPGPYPRPEDPEPHSTANGNSPQWTQSPEMAYRNGLSLDV